MDPGRAAIRARTLRVVAIGVGLLAVCLSVAALVLRWPLMEDAALPERITWALFVTVGVPQALVGALICAHRPRT